LKSSLAQSPFSGKRGSSHLSVVIPAHNAAATLRRAIDSVLPTEAASHAARQIVVIDDGSTDETFEIAQEYGASVVLKRTRNLGACAARNTGLELASGAVVCFLDADDYWLPGTAEALEVAANVDTPLFDLAVLPFAYEDRSGARRVGYHPQKEILPRAMSIGWLNGLFVPPCALAWRTTFVRSVGGWGDFLRDQDGELVLRALMHNPRVEILDSGLGVYVQHDGPGRVSRRAGRGVVEDQLRLWRSLWDQAQRVGWTDLKPYFAARFYIVAYEAAEQGVVDVSRDALRFARGLGFTGHRGTRLHKVLSTILGLELKMRIASRFRVVRRFEDRPRTIKFP